MTLSEDDNREDRTSDGIEDPAARIRFVPNGVQLSEALACPECSSECSTEELAPCIFSTTVHHDDWCPWLAELQRDLA